MINDLIRQMMLAQSRTMKAKQKAQGKPTSPAGLAASIGRMAPAILAGRGFGTMATETPRQAVSAGYTPAPAGLGATVGRVGQAVMAGYTPAPQQPSVAAPIPMGQVPTPGTPVPAKMSGMFGGAAAGAGLAGIGRLFAILRPQYEAARDQGFQGTFQDFVQAQRRTPEAGEAMGQAVSAIMPVASRFFTGGR